MDRPNDRDQPKPQRPSYFESGGLLDEDGLSRRKLLKLGGLGVGALALPGILAACGGGSSTSASTGGGGGGGETGLSPELEKMLDNIESKQVIIGNYGGGTEEARARIFFTPFEERTGVKVISASAGASAVAMLNAEIPIKWDAVNGSITESWGAQIHGKKTLPKMPKLAWEDLVEPKKFQPYMWQSFFLGFVPAMIEGTFSGAQPATWADLFDTKKFPGKRAWPSGYQPAGVLEAALLAEGVSPGELYPLDFERAQAKIESIQDDLVIYQEYSQAQTFLTSKTASMAFGPNALWKELEDKGVKMEIAWEVGPILEIGGMNTMAEAPNLDATEALAAFCNQPKLQAEFAEATNYGPPTEEAFEFLSPEQQEKLPNSPSRTNVIDTDSVYFAENYKEYEETATAAIGG